MENKEVLYRLKLARIFLVLLIPLLVGMIGNTAHAFKVEPLVSRMELKRGEKKELVITLENTATRTLHFEARATDYAKDPFGSNVFFREAYGEHSALEWMDLDSTKLTVFPKDIKEVHLTIKVPYTAEPGEYYATVMFDCLDPWIHGTVFQAEEYLSSPSIFLIQVPGRKSQLRKEAEVVEVRTILPDVENLELLGYVVDELKKNRVITETLWNKLREIESMLLPYEQYREEEEDLKREFTLNRLAYYSRAKTEAEKTRVWLLLRNESRVSIRAEGNVSLSGARSYYTFPLVAVKTGIPEGVLGKQRILAKGERYYEVRKTLRPGTYKSRVVFGIDEKKGRIAKTFEVTVPSEVGKYLSKFADLDIGTDLIEEEVKLGSYHRGSISIRNYDTQPAKIKVVALEETRGWLRLQTEVIRVRAARGRRVGQAKIRYSIYIPRPEQKYEKVEVETEKGKKTMLVPIKEKAKRDGRIQLQLPTGETFDIIVKVRGE